MNNVKIKRVLLSSLSIVMILGMSGCGSSQDEANTTQEPIKQVTIENGIAIDGILSGSTVCIDVNTNNHCDTDEDFNITNSLGEYKIDSVQKGPLYLFGGYDLGTKLPFTGALKAPQGSSVITPLTSALQAMIENGLTHVEAENSLKKAMGIPSSVELTKFNPLKESAGVNAQIVLEKQAKLQALVHGSATTLALADKNQSIAATMDEVFKEISKNFEEADSEVEIDATELEESINKVAQEIYKDNNQAKIVINKIAEDSAKSTITTATGIATQIKHATSTEITEKFNDGMKSVNSDLQHSIEGIFQEISIVQEGNTTVTPTPDVNETTENNTTVTPTPDSNETQETNTTVELSYELQSYYSLAIGKKRTELKSALHRVVSDSAIYLTYAQDYEYLSKTDKDFSKPNEDNLILFYLQTSFDADTKCRSISSGCWNREHMWPKSLGVGYDALINSYTDLHHLRPTDSRINSSRGNKPYGEATTPYSKIDGFYYDEKFEVSDVLKGEVARAILYMTVRYEGDNGEPDLEIYANDFSDSYPAELCTMYAWHHFDTVSEEEIIRNSLVQKYQGNRNPFVDNPTWVDDIWESECASVSIEPNDTNTSENNNSSSAVSEKLIFSEYIEGSSNNKVIEIYNAGDIPISLGEYQIIRYTNGKGEGEGVEIPLRNVLLNAGSTFIVAHSNSATELIAIANQTSGNLNHNGDDALALSHIISGTLVDMIGKIGQDPGSEWGNGDLTTKNHTLRRKSHIVTGDKNGSDLFDPAVEWEAFAIDTFDGLGVR